MSVAELHSLDYEEYIGWFQYFKQRPYGWREDLRAYYIMQSMAGSKAKPEEIFPSIKALKEGEEENNSRTEQTLRASAFGMLLQEHGIT